MDLGTLGSRFAEIEAQILSGLSSDASILEASRRRARIEREKAKELKKQLGAWLRQFAKDLDYEIEIPGTHTGGISNQELFEILAERGWDYGANTRRLKDHVKIALLDAFEDENSVPLVIEVQRVASDAILEWVAARLDGRVTDIERPALSPAYRKQKRKLYSIGRAGTASGELRDAITGRGRITFT